MRSGPKKFSSKDLIQRLVWSIIGYFTGLYGIVNLPLDDAARLLL